MAIASVHGHEQAAQQPVLGLQTLVGDVAAFHGAVRGVSAHVFRSRPRDKALTWQLVRARIEDGLAVDPCPDVIGEPGTASDAIRRSAARTLRVRRPQEWHPWIDRLRTGLSADLGTEVAAALYLSRPVWHNRFGGSGGAADVPRPECATGDHDVFVLQLDGRTHWTTEDRREDHGDHRSVSLAPGDVLYLPAQQAYASAVRESGSLHLVLSAPL
ncbi:cupin domain-containing protein [Streptomyces sp. NPDC050095]|uniref:JmjC domain-containing protein n=1 Tax=unclassified Streptomyces TaxID=2593676 RepID=UPI00341C82BC